MTKAPQSVEHHRLEEIAEGIPWRKWGCYLSERQWGTVREDYSVDGSAWESFTHDQARGRTYRWGEDGLAGICDDEQLLCFSIALWNGKDSILKERLFGLTGNQGNHGEDVKECYYYLDNTPTHSWMRMLYKYPQAAFPYEELLDETYRRSKKDPEYELIDTGVFDFDRYFDVYVEYAKGGPEDILVRVTAINRGPEAATLHVIPQLWFRNTWSWYTDGTRPRISMDGRWRIHAEHPVMGSYYLSGRAGARAIFCENDTNPSFVGLPSTPGYFKDGFHRHIVGQEEGAVNPAAEGTKAAFVTVATIEPGESKIFEYCLTREKRRSPFAHFEETIQRRRAEADAFFETVHGRLDDEELRMIQRQSLSGMLWSKQYYGFDVRRWLEGDENQPTPPAARKHGRNHRWQHLSNSDIISMPDKWEYPWYAAWDLAFHCLPLAMVDPDFAKAQLLLFVQDRYMHPMGQIPAYEWAFEDANPPVHAWATWRVYKIDQKARGGKGDRFFLESVFHKMLLNFGWWVNRKDSEGNNIFQGGFLGLDNIGVFDRSKPLPGGGRLDQTDGTAWMAMYCLNMLKIALELAQEDPVYEDMASKFFEHFLYIAQAMSKMFDGEVNLWDEEDEFFYDVLQTGGHRTRLKVRSIVGLIPLFAVETLEPGQLDHAPRFRDRMDEIFRTRPDLAELVSRWKEPGRSERRLLSLLRGHRFKRLLSRMLDEKEFLSDFGIRALSRHHAEHPFVFAADGQEHSVDYQPAESDSGMFGGNSNWRGPIWFPINFLLIESLQRFHHYFSDDFKVECPTGSGNFVTIDEAANEIMRRLIAIFRKDESGRRPVFAHCEKMATDPHFRDNLLFYEYFHGDIGRGVGASHQTGWTGLVAKLLRYREPEHETEHTE